MGSRTYSSALRKLYAVNLFHPKNSGTTQMDELYKRIGSPLEGVPVIHVAGTNGKGSVSVKIAEVLRGCGLKVGLFTSPHVSSFRERIQVNGQLIPESSVEAHVSDLFRISESGGLKSTFFELVTAVGCLHFRNSHCDAVVLEVGIGGRLDATNSVDTALSIVTSVQLDHTSLLGDSVEAIAAEKCGIFRSGVPALIGPDVPLDVAERVAGEKETTLYKLDEVLSSITVTKTNLVPRIIAAHDPEILNIQIAQAAVALFRDRYNRSLFSEVDTEVYCAALQKGLLAKPPCRYELYRVQQRTEKDSCGDSSVKFSSEQVLPGDSPNFRDELVLFDIAHNEAAIQALARKLNSDYSDRNIRAVFGMCRDKDVSACVRHLLSVVHPDDIHCVQAAQPRSLPCAELRSIVYQEASKLGIHATNDAPNSCVESKTIADAVDKALSSKNASADHSNSCKRKKGTLVVVCGSVFVMSEARASIGISEPCE